MTYILTKITRHKPPLELSNAHSPNLNLPYYHFTYKPNFEKSSGQKPKPPLDELSKFEPKPLPSHERVQLGKKGQEEHGKFGWRI